MGENLAQYLLAERLPPRPPPAASDASVATSLRQHLALFHHAESESCHF